MATTRIDLSGRRFGQLLVTGFSHSANSVHWRCLCDCGAEVVRRGGDLLVRHRRGQNQSCGCARSRSTNDGLIRCGKCKLFKSIDGFRKDAGASAGVHGHCRECQDAWRNENSLLLSRMSKEWRDKNSDRLKLVYANYRKGNLQRYAAHEARRRAMKLRATPVWADLEKIQAFYDEARRLGVQVDHIVPLRSPIVCGLHVEHNLQLLTKLENCTKNNLSWPDMP